MKSRFQTGVIRVVALALFSTSLVQYAGASVIGTQELIRAEQRAETISRVESLVAREDVGRRLSEYGVSPEMVSERLDNLTDAELLQLETAIDEQIVGADAVGVIGVVFLVLMILELVGVTDIFTAF